MNNGAILAVAALAGAGVGAGVTAFFMKRHYENLIFTPIEDEDEIITEIGELISEDGIVNQDVLAKVLAKESARLEESETLRKIREAGEKAYEDFVKTPREESLDEFVEGSKAELRALSQVEEAPKKSTVNIFDLASEDSNPANFEVMLEDVHDPGESSNLDGYFNEDNGYTKDEVTWYSDPEILTDSDDIPIPDPFSIIGPDGVEVCRHLVPGEKALSRNHRMRTDFLITCTDQAFQV